MKGVLAKRKLQLFSPNDYVDKVCIRCPRSMWSSGGSKECSECPVGRVKRISGEFDTETLMLNFPTPVSQYNMWYYQYNEQGTLEQDCALVPESLVHVPDVNDLMSYERKNFLPVVSCPFGYTTQAGSVANDQDYIERFIRDTVPESTLLPAKAFIEPPFVKERPNFLWNSVNGQTCTDSGMKKIESYEDCQEAAASFGVYNVQYRLGMFEGCWYIPSVNPNTAYWGVIGLQKCLPSLSYFCMQGSKQEDAWSHFTSQFCRRCPGESVSGPESGSCTTCYDNRIKQYSKDSIQMIAEKSITKMRIKSQTTSRRRLNADIAAVLDRINDEADAFAQQTSELYIDSNVLHEANINLEPIDETESQDLMAQITFESQYSSNLDLGDCLLGCLQMYNTDSYGITFDQPQTYPLKNTISQNVTNTKTLEECQSTCKTSEDCDFLIFEASDGQNTGTCKLNEPVEGNYEKVLEKQCFNAKTPNVQYDKAITNGHPKYYHLDQNYNQARVYHGCPAGSGGSEHNLGYRSCTSSHTGETSDLAGCESKCHNHDGCEFFVLRDNICYYKDVECDVAIPYYKEFTGLCSHNINFGHRIYEGNSDNTGTYREQVERCALGCSNRRGSDSFSSPDKVYGFSILMGKCVCTFVDPADCTRVSSGVYSDWHQFTFREPFTWNVGASNPSLNEFPVVRAYAYTNDAKNEYPDGTSLCDASPEKRIEECAKACHERPFQYHTSEDTGTHLSLEDKGIHLRFANGFF